MRIRFLEPAQQEVDDAVAWYEEHEEDFGRDFLSSPSRNCAPPLERPSVSRPQGTRSNRRR